MNKQLKITDALKGRAVQQLPWQYDCTCCGRDNGMAGGAPIAVACVECGERIEAKDNPLYVRPSMLTLAAAE